MLADDSQVLQDLAFSCLWKERQGTGLGSGVGAGIELELEPVGAVECVCARCSRFEQARPSFAGAHYTLHASGIALFRVFSEGGCLEPAFELKA